MMKKIFTISLILIMFSVFTVSAVQNQCLNSISEELLLKAAEALSTLEGDKLNKDYLIKSEETQKILTAVKKKKTKKKTTAQKPSGNSGAPPKMTGSSGGRKPRTIITTDLGADPDDIQSMVHFLVCANEFQVEALVVSTSCWRKNQSNTNMLNNILNAYSKAYGNLSKHAKGFPSPGYLKSVSGVGQKGYGMGSVGSGKDSFGSNAIIKAVDKGGPLWVQSWGGSNTVAQALWKVKNTRSAAAVKNFVSKLRVYDILGQDDAGAWLTKNFPSLIYIRFMGVYSWQYSDGWVSSNVQSHGPLGKIYPKRKYATEGDTPAFLYLMPNGLSDPDKLDWGSWGGRVSYSKKRNLKAMSAVNGQNKYSPYMMYSDASEGGRSISKWKQAISNNFAARMDWSIKGSYSQANHHPVAVLNGDQSKKVMIFNASAGSKLSFNASGSKDPDNNNLSYSWSHYKEPSSYKGNVSIAKNGSSASVSVPAGAKGKNIHIILTVSDNGSPSLCSYRRAVINVR